MSTENFFTKSATETREIAARFAAQIARQNSVGAAIVLALQGDLGAGKTTFVQGFAEGLGIREVVNSPTFVIMRRFSIGNSTFKNFYHVDCYRLESPEALLQLGILEIIKNPENIVAIEWPEKIANVLPKNTHYLQFRHMSEGQREISVLQCRSVGCAPSMDKRLIIIDSSSLLYRAFHALPPLTGPAGQPTGAVYGFLLALFKAMKDTQATHIVACFDTPKATFRHEAFEQYKAHRPATPDAIVQQFPILKEVLASLNVPILEKEGFEADDLIATIAKKMEHQASVCIVSGDLDNLQLVNENIQVYTPGKNIRESVIYDTQKVVERFGVQPGQMNDFKALVGDVSDNVPGVPGVGKTTAAELIREHGTLQAIYDELATDTLVAKPKVKEALRLHRDDAFLSRRLVETRQDVPVDVDLGSCQFGLFDAGKIKSVFGALGFVSLLSRIPGIV